MDDVYALDWIKKAIREQVQIKLGPNALEIANNGGSNWLTSSEAELAASIALDTLKGLGWTAPGEVPPWMQWAASVETDSDSGCNYREVYFYASHESAPSGTPLYRLASPKAERSQHLSNLVRASEDADLYNLTTPKAEES